MTEKFLEARIPGHPYADLLARGKRLGTSHMALHCHSIQQRVDARRL